MARTWSSTVRQRRAARFTRWWALLVAVVVMAAAGLAAVPAGRQWLHDVDARLFGERVMDTMTRLRSGEDWSMAEPLRTGQDYAWLRAGGSPIRVAHALGESGASTANTLAAARRAYEAGLRILEVDLVLENGELRCQHDRGPQDHLVKDGCTFETLMRLLPKDAWVVLDIKTDFEAVGQQVVDHVKGTEDAHRVVFQLYRPVDFALFNRWQAEAPLPGPLLTAYLAHRRIDHVAQQAMRIGVQALTLPLDRLPALTSRPAGAAVLVHPVHNCAAWADAMHRADGVYVLSTLRCAAPPSAATS